MQSWNREFDTNKSGVSDWWKVKNIMKNEEMWKQFHLGFLENMRIRAKTKFQKFAAPWPFKCLMMPIHFIPAFFKDKSAQECPSTLASRIQPLSPVLWSVLIWLLWLCLLIGDELQGPRRYACFETVFPSRSHAGNTQTEDSREAFAMVEEKMEVVGALHSREPPFALCPRPHNR